MRLLPFLIMFPLFATGLLHAELQLDVSLSDGTPDVVKASSATGPSVTPVSFALSASAVDSGGGPGGGNQQENPNTNASQVSWAASVDKVTTEDVPQDTSGFNVFPPSGLGNSFAADIIGALPAPGKTDVKVKLTATPSPTPDNPTPTPVTADPDPDGYANAVFIDLSTVPKNVGISSKGTYAHDRTVHLTATVYPASAAKDVFLSAEAKLTISNQKVKAGVISYDLVGVTASKDPDDSNVQADDNLLIPFEQYVTVVIPAGIKSPKTGPSAPDSITDGFSNTVPPVALEYPAGNPPPGYPTNYVGLLALLYIHVHVQIFDQLNRPLDTIYKDADVIEIKSATSSSDIGNLDANGQYVDPVGPFIYKSGVSTSSLPAQSDIVVQGSNAFNAWVGKKNLLPTPPAVPATTEDTNKISIDGTWTLPDIHRTYSYDSNGKITSSEAAPPEAASP